MKTKRSFAARALPFAVTLLLITACRSAAASPFKPSPAAIIFSIGPDGRKYVGVVQQGGYSFDARARLGQTKPCPAGITWLRYYDIWVVGRTSASEYWYDPVTDLIGIPATTGKPTTVLPGKFQIMKWLQGAVAHGKDINFPDKPTGHIDYIPFKTLSDMCDQSSFIAVGEVVAVTDCHSNEEAPDSQTTSYAFVPDNIIKNARPDTRPVVQFVTHGGNLAYNYYGHILTGCRMDDAVSVHPGRIYIIFFSNGYRASAQCYWPAESGHGVFEIRNGIVKSAVPSEEHEVWPTPPNIDGLTQEQAVKTLKQIVSSSDTENGGSHGQTLGSSR